MKRIILILTFFAFSIITNSALAKEKKNEKTITFSVNMDCHSCVNKIEGNISYEKGVKDLNVSLDNKECTVTFRTDKTNVETIIKAFDKIGYTAKVKKEVKKKDKGENDHLDTEIQKHIH